MIVTLTGFMGCGKSCTGRELAALAGWRHIDLDGWIEAHEGRSVRSIFTEEGEPAFRRMELKSLRQIIGGEIGARAVAGDADAGNKGGGDAVESAAESDVLVVSLGGGTLTFPEAERLVHSETFCVYLRAGMETLLHSLTLWPGDRPMLGDRPDTGTLRRRIEELMAARAAVYERAARRIIDVDGREYRDIAMEIMAASTGNPAK